MPAFQRSAIPQMIAKCREAIASAPDDQTADEIAKCIAFWEQALKQEYDPNVKLPFGWYVIHRVSANVSSDEWTNVGVAIYDKDEKLIWHRMGPFGRAIKRGDVHPVYHDHLTNRAAAYPDLSSVKRALRSMGHMMSSVQMTEPRATALDEECYISLYEGFVLGVKPI